MSQCQWLLVKNTSYTKHVDRNIHHCIVFRLKYVCHLCISISKTPCRDRLPGNCRGFAPKSPPHHHMPPAVPNKWKSMSSSSSYHSHNHNHCHNHHHHQQQHHHNHHHNPSILNLVHGVEPLHIDQLCYQTSPFFTSLLLLNIIIIIIVTIVITIIIIIVIIIIVRIRMIVIITMLTIRLLRKIRGSGTGFTSGVADLKIIVLLMIVMLMLMLMVVMIFGSGTGLIKRVIDINTVVGNDNKETWSDHAT